LNGSTLNGTGAFPVDSASHVGGVWLTVGGGRAVAPGSFSPFRARSCTGVGLAAGVRDLLNRAAERRGRVEMMSGAT
jgi:hypothetical protein